MPFLVEMIVDRGVSGGEFLQGLDVSEPVRRQNIWDKCSCFLTEDLAHLSLQLNRLTLMFQAAVLDGEFFDFLPPFDDCGVSPEVGVSGG